MSISMNRDWWNDEFRQLVTLGESTTAGGWSSNRERCWASQLARLINEFQRVPAQLFNVGIGANVISPKSPVYPRSCNPAATERLDKHVLAHKPDLLVISYGLNDARGGTPIDLFCNEMRHIIDRVRQEIRPLIVLLGPYYMIDFTLGGVPWSHSNLDHFHEYNTAIRGVAESTDCLFVDLLATCEGADWIIHYDGCHANDLGHRIIANKIFEVLATHCSGLARQTKALEQRIPRWRDETTLRRDYGVEIE